MSYLFINSTLFKGKMPAKYGGRLSSVLDIAMKEGDNQKKNTELSVGLISSRFYTEGPIKKNKSSYLFSARSSYLGLLALPSRISYNNGKNGSYANYWMYDVNAKVNFDLGKNSKLYASFYSGNDVWNTKSKESTGKSTFDLLWGNRTFSLRYHKLIRQKVFFISQATFNRYNYSTQQSFTSNEKEQSNYLKSSFIQDVTFKNSFQWSPFFNHAVEAGMEIAAQTLVPQSITNEEASNAPIIPEKAIAYKGVQSSLFIDDKISITNRLFATIGVRMATFNTGGKGFIFVEPRTNFHLALTSNSNLEFSYRENNQALHLLTSSGIGLPNDIWIPATANIRPSHGRMFSGGYNILFEKQDVLLSVEGYYRNMSNLIDFQQGLNFFNIGKDWEDAVEKNGRGRAYGVELMAHKKSGRLNGWAAYTLAWNERKFTNINDGAWFPHQYDRRHEISLTGNYKISDTWALASNFVFSTGNAFTTPSYFVIKSQNGQTLSYAPIFVGKNNSRAPAYHRLDFSATKSYVSKKGRKSSWNFGVYNVYAHNNPFYIDISIYPFYAANTNAPDKIAFNYTVGSIFNLIPSISYAVKF